VSTAAETYEWIDGPSLVKWLESRGLECPKRQLGRDLETRIRDWRRGSLASVYTADKVCLTMHLHLSEIPDELYRAKSPRDKLPAAMVAEMRRRVLKGGELAPHVARDLGCDPNTVRRYVKANPDLLGGM
jgi:hypothetical protein